MWVQAYYPKTRLSSPTPANLPWDLMTHLAFFSMAPTSTGGIINTSGVDLTANIASVRTYSQANDVKLLVVIGGSSAATDSTWRSAVSSTYRATFVANIAQYVSDNQLDGVDIDWEPFDTSGDATDFALFIADLRTAMPSPLIITVFINTTPSWKQTLANTIQGNVDKLGLSTYDFSYSDTLTVHDSPLYTSGSQPASESADAAVTAFLGAGVAASKINIAIPHYAQVWAGYTSLYEVATPNTFTQVQYKNLTGASSTTEPTGALYDSSAQAAYINGDPFTSFSSVDAVEAKINYVNANNLGGVIIWEISQAYFSGTTPHYPLMEPFAGHVGNLAITGISSISNIATITL